MPRKDKPTRIPTAKIVRDYIDTHPSIKDCLKDDLVNLSALSRQVMKDQGISSMEAILVACRRYKDASPRHNERTIKQTLAKSKVEMSSKVAIVTLRNDWQIYGKLQGFLRKALSEGHVPKMIQGSKAITLITDENTAETVEEEIGKTNLLAFDKGLVEIAVTSPESIRTTPGIMAYLYGSLSSNGINIVETMSTYTDTIFIVEPQNMMRAFEVLTKCIQG
ncbi:MAG TPA: ACT domain-containing protein [Candidatus Thermoplasmatota archaeon]|nr:ACT domain-containing protein [Candidatus Thermoplasmatota archaeon]